MGVGNSLQSKLWRHLVAIENSPPIWGEVSGGREFPSRTLFQASNDSTARPWIELRSIAGLWHLGSPSRRPGPANHLFRKTSHIARGLRITPV